MELPTENMLPFLGMILRKDSQNITTSVHMKLTNTGLLLHYDNCLYSSVAFTSNPIIYRKKYHIWSTYISLMYTPCDLKIIVIKTMKLANLFHLKYCPLFSCLEYIHSLSLQYTSIHKLLQSREKNSLPFSFSWSEHRSACFEELSITL